MFSEENYFIYDGKGKEVEVPEGITDIGLTFKQSPSLELVLLKNKSR